MPFTLGLGSSVCVHLLPCYARRLRTFEMLLASHASMPFAYSLPLLGTPFPTVSSHKEVMEACYKN